MLKAGARRNMSAEDDGEPFNSVIYRGVSAGAVQGTGARTSVHCMETGTDRQMDVSVQRRLCRDAQGQFVPELTHRQGPAPLVSPAGFDVQWACGGLAAAIPLPMVDWTWKPELFPH